jgi:hypothetical protein
MNNMTPQQVFSIANLVAVAGWLILIVAGRARWAAALVTGAVLPLLFAILYGGLIAAHWGETPGGFSSLIAVQELFSNPWLLLAGWVHYLAFDLFVGSWQVRDAQEHRIPHLAVVPGLILTFLFGPVGLLLYFMIRLGKNRTLRLDSASRA